MTTSTTSSRVECGYCGSQVAVNAATDWLRAHQRTIQGSKEQCPGSGQRAWVYPGNLLPGDEVQPRGGDHRIRVASKPTVARDSNVWTFKGYDPAGPETEIHEHRLRGNALLRLWTRQGGENR